MIAHYYEIKFIDSDLPDVIISLQLSQVTKFEISDHCRNTAFSYASSFICLMKGITLHNMDLLIQFDRFDLLKFGKFQHFISGKGC